MKKIVFLLIVVLSVSSCNKNEQFLDDAFCDNQSEQILINDEQEADILKMIDYLNNSKNEDTRLRSDDDPPVDSSEHRVYLTWWWCSGTGGNCLPDLIVTKGSPTSTSLDIFYSTVVGKILDSKVKSGEFTLEINENKKTKTTFLIYSSSSQPSKSMVIPLVIE